MEENIATIREGYGAYKRKDFPALMANLSPAIEAEQSELVPWGGTYHGLDGFGEFMSNLTTYVDTEVIPEEFVEAGDTIVVIGRSRGSVKATGRAFDIRTVHVWKLRDGKVVALSVYLDTPAMLESLGQSTDKEV
jgi:hypothetical protein